MGWDWCCVAPLQPHMGWVFLNGGDQPTAAAAGCKVRDPLTYGYGLWNILPSTSARGGGECPLTTGTGNSTDPPPTNNVSSTCPHVLLRRSTLHFFSFRSTQVVAVAARSDTVRSRSRHGRGRRQPRETEPTRVSRPLATTKLGGGGGGPRRSSPPRWRVCLAAAGPGALMGGGNGQERRYQVRRSTGPKRAVVHASLPLPDGDAYAAFSAAVPHIPQSR
jgi:hypothetical protein